MNELEKSLGLPKAVQGKSYAEAAKYIEDLFKGRNDPVSLRTKKTFFNRLRKAQEAEKAALESKARAEQEQAMAQIQASGQGQEIAEAATTAAVDNANQFSIGGDIMGMTQFGSQAAAENTQWASNPKDFGLFGSFGSLGRAAGSVGNWLGNNGTNIIGGLGLAASTLAPLIYNKRQKDNLEKPKDVDAYTLNPGMIQENLVNRQQIERNLANQTATSRQAALEGAGGDVNTLMNTYTGIGTGTAGALANAMLQSDIADAQEKARVQQGRAAIMGQNAQQQMRADEINVANQAAYDDLMASYGQGQAQSIANLGQTAFNYMQSKKYVDALRKAMQFKNI